MISSSKYRTVIDRIYFIAICLFCIIIALPIILIIAELIIKGIKNINFEFFTRVAPDTMDAMFAKMGDESVSGGILNGICGSLLIIAIAIVIAIPLGTLVGIYIFENKSGKFATITQFISEILYGIPSIVIGIIIYVWIVRGLHNFSALAGGVSLATIMLPMIIRSTQQCLDMIPDSLKEAGFALGGSYSSVIFRLIIPTARGGLATGILLAISRVIGETAPLVITAMGASMINWDILKPTSSMSLLIWEFFNDSNTVDLMWSASLLLLSIVIILNIIAKYIARNWKAIYGK